MTTPDGGNYSAFPSNGSDGSDGVSLREYACIQLRVPETGQPWLDEIIRRARREEFAGQALSGMYEDSVNSLEPVSDEWAAIACQLADAVVAAADPQATWRKSTEGKP